MPGSRTLVRTIFAGERQIIGNSRRCHKPNLEKKHVHVAQSPAETYAITCKSAPVIKGLIVELAN